MKAAGLAIAILVLCACGTTPAGNHSSSPSPVASVSPSPVAGSPAPRPNLLVALLQSSDPSKAGPGSFNTVVIASLQDGHVLASATFAPMPTPKLGCMGAVLPPSAHAVGGKIYYADGHGTVRSLAADGTTATVAKLPLTSAQQMLSFAISPDATRVLAGLFTAPVNAYPCSGATNTGAYSFDAYSGPVGGAMQLVSHQSWTGHSHQVLSITGWDAVGPIGRLPSVWASQGGGPGSTVGVFARIDPNNMHATPLGNTSSCFVWDSNAAGSSVCMASAMTAATSARINTAFSVNRPDGSNDWSFTVSDLNEANSPVLAPDGQHVAVCCDFDTAGEFLVSRDGKQSLLAGQFFASGWVDSNTVFGWTDASNDRPLGTASFVSLSAPKSAVPLGFSGLYVGPIA